LTKPWKALHVLSRDRTVLYGQKDAILSITSDGSPASPASA
jgi:hypothetical protein